jgi:hypothetical protein
MEDFMGEMIKEMEEEIEKAKEEAKETKKNKPSIERRLLLKIHKIIDGLDAAAIK